MPDENTNPVWATQTSQNDQAATNQSWDDFVLDFWERENNEQDTKSEVEIGDLVDENREEEGSGDDFDINLFGDNEKTESSEDNNGIQDEEVKNGEFYNDFDNLPKDNGEETMEENGEETMEESREEILEENGEETLEENGEETLEKNGEEENTADNDFDINLFGDNEKTESSEDDNKIQGEEIKNRESDNDFDNSPEENRGEVEDFTISLNEDSAVDNNSSHLDEKGDDGESNKVDTSPIIDELEGNKEQGIIAEPEEKLDGIAGDDTNTYFWNDATDPNPWKMEEVSEEPINNDSNSVIDNAELALKQPEITDLLWESSTDFSMQEQKNDIEKTDNELTEISQPISNEAENPNFLQEEKEWESENENHLIENEKELTNAPAENQSFTLDYTESNWNEHGEISTNKAPERIVNVETSNITEVNQTNADINQMENVNQVEGQQISTLSLDQILDTELTNNPQITEKSTAEPVNITSNKWSFSSGKMTWIIAWVGVALLAGLVVVLAFPVGTSKEKNSPTEDEQIVEEYIGEHQVATPEESMEENPENTKEELENSGWDVDIHSGRVTVQYDFPETGWEEEGGSTSEWGGDSSQWRIDPYVCEGDDCSYEWWNQWKTFEIWDILPIISDYKSQAEQYYSQWDEMQDKKLVKLSLKAIYLCNSYEEQINNWESLDEESLSSFESKIGKLLDKMQNYLGGDDYESLQNNTKRNYFE